MGISDQIDLRQLRAFVAVAEELNFRRAAERLHVSQPPLSRTVAALEKQLGAPLLMRDRRHCELTPLGRQVLADARRLLADIAAATARWRGPDRRPQRLRLGMFFAMDPGRFPALEKMLGRRLRDVPVDFNVGRTHFLVPQVRQGTLDAAIVLLPADVEGVECIPLVRTEMVALLPATHPLARRRSVAVKDLDAFDCLLFVHRRESAPLHDHLDGLLRARGLVSPRYRLPEDIHAGLAQVAAGRACSLVCRTMASASRHDVAFRPLRSADRLPVDLALVCRAGLPAAWKAALVGAARRHCEPYASA